MASNSARLPATAQQPPAARYFTYYRMPASGPPSPPTSPNIRPKNVILFGETGTGKSSTINLMAGRDVASTSSDSRACTLAATEYAFTLSSTGMPLRIFDTVGLEEPGIDFDTFFGAIEKAQRLITNLYKTGGIDLLLFCVRGGRVTNVMQRNYRLFFEFLCDKQVPVAIVVTHLENESVMEDWWSRNRETFTQYGIVSVAHACITSIPERVTLYAERRVQSRGALEKLFQDALAGTTPYAQVPKDWITALIEKISSFFANWLPFKKRAIMKQLEERCKLPRNEAQRLAEMIMKHKT